MSNRNSLSDKLVIIDLEATCDNPRPQWNSEIIEIGVCLLDLRTLNISESRGILVKPENSPITPFCTSLTTITPEMVRRDGVTLQQALKVLKDDYKIDQRAWASWGDYDRNQLLRECDRKRLVFWGDRSPHFNLKHLIALEHGWAAKEGMDQALKKFGITLEGTHHRGIDDAFNIAKIYAAHLRKIRSA